MKARGGFTLIELLLAGAILSTIAFGAISGILHISGLVDKRAELMAADGYCWDVAWRLFSCDYSVLAECQASLTNGNRRCEIKGYVMPKNRQSGAGRYEFLPSLQYPDSPPVCYITISNAVNSAGDTDAKDGICIGVNLEWGPRGNRSILLATDQANMADVHAVYDHPISVFRSRFSRNVK